MNESLLKSPNTWDTPKLHVKSELKYEDRSVNELAYNFVGGLLNLISQSVLPACMLTLPAKQSIKSAFFKKVSWSYGQVHWWNHWKVDNFSPVFSLHRACANVNMWGFTRLIESSRRGCLIQPAESQRLNAIANPPCPHIFASDKTDANQRMFLISISASRDRKNDNTLVVKNDRAMFPEIEPTAVKWQTCNRCIRCAARLVWHPRLSGWHKVGCIRYQPYNQW